MPETLKLEVGAGRVHERSGELAAKIKALCYVEGAFLPLAAVLGVLQIVGDELLKEHN